MENILEQNFTSNAILFSKSPTEDIYFLPAYARIKCKGFTGLDVKNVVGTMSTTIFLTVFYGDLHEEIVELIRKKAVLEVNRGDPIKLEDSLFITTRRNPTEKTLSFTIRKNLQTRMDPHIFWTPFEILNMILTINLRPISG